MLSVATRNSGQVDTCDSKRGYLCSIVGSCLHVSGLEMTETTKTADVLLLLGVKQQCLCLYDYIHCLHYTLCLLQLSFAYNLILSGDTDVISGVDY